MRNGGLGDSVLQSVHDLQPKFASLAIPNRFVSEYGSYQEHCEDLGFTPAGIFQTVQDAFGVP